MADLKKTAGKITKNKIVEEMAKKVIVNDLLDTKPAMGKGKLFGLLAAAGAALTMIAQYLGN